MAKPPSIDDLKSLAGQKVGEYIIDEYVNRGKVGAVFKAHREEFGDEVVALKLMFGEQRPNWENEIKKVVKLALIKNVVHFKNLGQGTALNRSVTYTVWDYIPPGRNLRQYLEATTEKCSPSRYVAIITTILAVLHAVQLKGVKRHGDLHPGNILVGDADVADINPATGVVSEPIYVSDFGYGASNGELQPKDDYRGLKIISDLILEHIDLDNATATDRQTLTEITRLLSKLLTETDVHELTDPKNILARVQDIIAKSKRPSVANEADTLTPAAHKVQVGDFHVSEMLGDNWKYWRELFVATIPKRLGILDSDLTTVLCGPRGCGRTMIFQRLSKRLMIACGPVPEMPEANDVVGFYINSNDIAAPFPAYPSSTTELQQRRLIAGFHLCLLSEVLATQVAVSSTDVPEELLTYLNELFGNHPSASHILEHENRLDRYRYIIEKLKPSLIAADETSFPGFRVLSYIGWFQQFVQSVLRPSCKWIDTRKIFLFVDDYSAPRVQESMQIVLNRLLFQRSSEFLCRISTEAFTTFIPRDMSGKTLQQGDDFRLIDMAAETIVLKDDEREEFLNEVFRRRLKLDNRTSSKVASLKDLLGNQKTSKTEFARLLRSNSNKGQDSDQGNLRRGKAKAKALYAGSQVFAGLWSGDTRQMVQLMQDIVSANENSDASFPIQAELQDRIYRTGGANWLSAITRNEPDSRISALVESNPTAIFPGYAGGSYGTHLKAIAEAFKDVARELLNGPTYDIETPNGPPRVVPRMAFRIEIVDNFRLNELATHVYNDLIRYGIFLLDERGKSVRGAMVPRLYLRRLLLPYSLLALAARDNVLLTSSEFEQLLLDPDAFKSNWMRKFVSRNHSDKTPDLFDPKPPLAPSDNSITRANDDYDDTGG
jgi:hypothetical protein